jgi:hypothetical protein
MEHNQNPFAPADAAWPPPRTAANLSSAAPSAPAAEAAEPPTDIFDFDPVAVRARSDGWTPVRQRAFIEELADCGIVREAADRVGMTGQSATRLRRRPEAAAFSLAWDAALRIGGERIRSVAWERAVAGIVKPRFYRGEKIGEERIYDNRLLLSLLAKLPEPAVDEGAVQRVIGDWEGWMDAIEHGLEAPPHTPDRPDEPPVCRDDDDGSLWTSFPPPPGFNGEEMGEWGDEEYFRALTSEERAIFEAKEAREEQHMHRRRDAFFARLK